MKLKFISIISLIMAVPTAFALAPANGFPCLLLINGNNNSYIAHDPNWDDQQLIVNGHKVHAFQALLKPDDSIKICGLYYEFGLIFENGHQDYLASAEIANDGRSKNTEITLYPKDQVKYQVLSQSPALLVLKLIN